MEHTHKLALPYLMAAQAQKHVTHNEALRMLDAIVHISVAQKEADSLPDTPADGEQVIVSQTATPPLAEHAGKVAAWQDNAWAFYTPCRGWTAWVEGEGRLLVFDGTDWQPSTPTQSLNPVAHIGVNATADDANRLAVRSPATLLSHDGGDHRVVVNKADTGATASHLFQTNYSGRAEFGLAGSDRFSIKVSPDGSQWNEAVSIAPDTAIVTLPAGVQLGSSGPALEVYEEGEWTPSLVGSVVAGNTVYTIASASYVRIGSMVFAVARLAWSSLGGMDGFATINNLPFRVRPGIKHRFPITVAWYNHLNMDTRSTMLGGFSEPGSRHVRLWGALAAHEGINRLLTPADLSESGEISFSIAYMCDNQL